MKCETQRRYLSSYKSLLIIFYLYIFLRKAYKIWMYSYNINRFLLTLVIHLHYYITVLTKLLTFLERHFTPVLLQLSITEFGIGMGKSKLLIFYAVCIFEAVSYSFQLERIIFF